jgi:hypothetical protein
MALDMCNVLAMHDVDEARDKLEALQPANFSSEDITKFLI